MSTEPATVKKPGVNISWMIFFTALTAAFWIGLNSGNAGFFIPPAVLGNFTTIFISIILEALPFVMIGVAVSSVIQVFVSEEMIARIIPKNKLLGLFAASLMGFIFPICECANVPVTRRLVKKGVPLHIGITFMMAVAIVNPVTLLSTYYAFSGQISIVIMRAGMGLISAILIGYIVSMLPLKGSQINTNLEENEHSCGSCDCGDPDHTGHGAEGRPGTQFAGRITEIIEHTSIELFAVGRFLILGAFISSGMQTFLPRSILMTLGQGPVLSVLVMMALAYVLSLCSEADAFIARTFVGYFSTGSIFAFILFGPMIDIKNTLMLLHGFKWKFVITLIVITFTVCFSFALFINFTGI